jgi:hypothetical protein
MMAQPPFHRRKASNALSALVGDAVAAVLKQRGFATTAVLTEWREIVGPRLSQWTTPLEIRWPRKREGDTGPARNSRTQKAEGATLVVSCPGPFAMEVQMGTREILEAVNRRLGFGAVSALVIKQAPRPAPVVVKTRPTPDQAAIETVARELKDIESDELRHALAKWGASIRLSSLQK